MYIQYQNDQFFLPFSVNCSQVAMFQIMPALCLHRQGKWVGGGGGSGQPNVDRPGQGEGGPKNSQICADILYGWPHFKKRNAYLSCLFHHSKTIKIADKVKSESCLFINKHTNNRLPSFFTNWFTFPSMYHNYQTSFASKGNLQIPSVQTRSYGKKGFYLNVYKNLE